jgi:CheY-like chemotaxis protein
VQLRLELRDDLPSVQGDASQLQQLVMNLLINGAEAIGPDKTGTVLVTTSLQDVDETCRLSPNGSFESPPGSYVSLEVHDTGCGMDEVTVNRTFNPFFTTKFTGPRPGGVRGIVQGHKGTINVLSRPGEGTTFRVLFPVTEEVAVPKAAPAPHIQARHELILVIDDEDIIRRTAKSVLEHYGYRVVLAANGKEGVDLFQVLTEKASAVLLDMTTPFMNGEEALRHLKEINPAIKAILSSGYDEVGAIRRFSGKGLAGFIQKPYSAVTLAEKIRSMLA